MGQSGQRAEDKEQRAPNVFVHWGSKHLNTGTRQLDIGSNPSGLLLQSTMLSEEAKDKLRQTLEKVHEWPAVYMYKFIFEPDQERLEAVLALFPEESEILRKYSAGGKYLAITVKEVMISADEVVKRYDRASEISGVITL